MARNMFTDFIGQSHILEDLSIQIQASINRNELPDPICVHGAKGMGKTKLALAIHQILKDITKKPFQYFEKSGDDLTIPEDFIGLTYGTRPKVIFIDELQGMKPIVQKQILREYMDLVKTGWVGRKKVGRVCWVFATTDWGEIVEPVRSRITNKYRLGDYSLKEMMQIAKLIGKKNSLEIENNVAELIAKSARFCPREVENFIIRMEKETSISKGTLFNIAQGMCNRSKIYPNGLNEVEVQLLELLHEETGDGAIGNKKKGIAKSRLMSALDINKTDYETIYKRYLIRWRYIETTSAGERISFDGEEYLREYKEELFGKRID